MSVDVFIERSRFGKVFYDLREGRLAVSGRRGFERFDVEVELHSMSHRFERGAQRFWRPIFVGFGIGSALLLIAGALVVQTTVPVEAVIYFAEIAGIFGAAFLVAGIRWLPRLEVLRFKDVVGRAIFDIVRENGAAAETDEFVELLQRRIVESKTPNLDNHSALE